VSDEWNEHRAIAWMTRVFEAATSGASIFDPAVFQRLADAARDAIPHDRLLLATLDGASHELRVVACARRPGLAPFPSDADGSILETRLGTPARELPERFVADSRDTPLDTLREHMTRDRIESVLVVPLRPLEQPRLHAWLVFEWLAPGEASKVPVERLSRLSRLVRVLVGPAHDHARARRFAAMLDQMPHAVLALSAAHTVIEANRSALALFGRETNELRGRAFEELLDPAAQAIFRDAIAHPSARSAHVFEVVTSRGPMLADVVITAVSGDPAVVRQISLQDARPRIADEAELESRAEALAFLRELAELVATEINVGSAFDRVAQLITTRLPVRGVAIARCEGTDRNLAVVASRGLNRRALEAVAAMRGHDVPESAVDGVADFPAPIQSALGADRPSLLVPLRHADQLVGLALFSSPSRISHHTRDLVLAASRTVAVALHASIEFAEVARLAAERRQLLDSIPTLVFRLDPRTGATLYANAAVETILGKSVDEVLGLPGLEGAVADEEDRADIAATRESVMSGADSQWMDVRFSHRQGRIRILRLRLYPVRTPHGDRDEDTVVEGIAQDVTDEIESRKQLIQADRLASLGMLAAGVAHEINNPTAFISLGVQQLGRLAAQLPEDGPDSVRRRMSDVIEELADGVQRIVQIVGELKLFARIPESAFSTPVDVNRLITSALTLARSELRNRARVDLDLGELPPLPGDHARLGQVFVNLLINAAQAIPPGDEERNRILVRTRAFDGYVQVDVSDTGVGIPRENLTRIFDPFFTTKAPGEGTGLGLAISFDLVKRAGGTIDVESEVGRGTTFNVKLPVRQFVPPRGSKPQIGIARPGGRVLVVEDEQHLGVAVARVLASNYMVELAPDAMTALERIEAGAGSEYDAVLCDLRMPGMDGKALFESVSEKWPAQARRFVFLTGAGFGGEYESFIRSTDRPVVEKPFDMGELEEVVARVVAGDA
jgi:PAS domain S-box-containing protein